MFSSSSLLFFLYAVHIALFAKAAGMEKLAEGPRRIGGVEYKAKTRLSELNPKPNFRPSNVRGHVFPFQFSHQTVTEQSQEYAIRIVQHVLIDFFRSQ